MTSGTSGYFPNPTLVCTFDDYHGKYTNSGEICINDTYGISFNAQFTSVIQNPNTNQYIACADRWLPYDWIPEKAKETLKEYEDGFADCVPDLSTRTPQPLSGDERECHRDAFESRYVWLPIEWDGDMPRIRWYDEWKITE